MRVRLKQTFPVMLTALALNSFAGHAVQEYARSLQFGARGRHLRHIAARESRIGLEQRAGHLFAEERPSVVLLAAALDTLKAGKRKAAQALSAAASDILALDSKHRFPGVHMLKALQAEDKPSLLAAFRARPLKQRESISWALSWLGGADVRDAFCNALDKDYRGRVFSMKELHVCGRILEGLGELAGEDDIALNYLLERISPQWWSGHMTWKMADLHTRADRWMAGLTIQSIGMSGRQALTEVKQRVFQWDAREIRSVSGDLVTAYFFRSFRNGLNRKQFVEKRAAGWWDQHEQWEKTGAGRAWHEWYNKVNGIE